MVKQKIKNTYFQTTDCFLLPIITFIGVATRFWLQAWPDRVTFDEVHFGGFTNGYISRKYFFDIHPPLAKLLIASISYLGGYDGKIDFDSKYSEQYGTADYVTLRFVPEFFASFVPSLIYVSMRCLHFSYISSLVSASYALFETSLICEGRFILTDGILHFFVALHISTLFYSAQNPNLWSLIANGLTLGCACSCKSTAWGLPVLNAIVHIFFCLKNSNFNIKTKFDYIIYSISYRGFILLSLLMLTYYACFAVHIIVLMYNGEGAPFLDDETKKTLINENSSEPLSRRLGPPRMPIRIFALNDAMHGANMGIKSFHPYQSSPLSWPLLTSCYVAFIVIDNEKEVDCMGNVFIYYPAFFATIWLAINFFRDWRYFSIVVAYILHFLPFLLIPRCMFLYHYHLPLFFAIMAVGAVVDMVKWKKTKILIASLLIIFAIFGFWIWQPFVYGTQCSFKEMRIWSDNWIWGDAEHRELASQKNK